MATTYWVDVTELSNIRDVYQATRPVVAVLLLDNYEDAIKSLDESSRSLVLSEITRKFGQWSQDAKGVFCRLERDRYLFIFEQQYLDEFRAEKFALLDQVRAIETPQPHPRDAVHRNWDGRGIPWPICTSLPICLSEMALSRGGRSGGAEEPIHLRVLRRPGQGDGEAHQGQEPGVASAWANWWLTPPACSLWATRSRIWTRWEPPSACAPSPEEGGACHIISGREGHPSRGSVPAGGADGGVQGPLSGHPGGPAPGGFPISAGGGGPTGLSRCRAKRCWPPATRWRSSTTTAGRPPTSRGGLQFPRALRLIGQRSWSPSSSAISWTRQTC